MARGAGQAVARGGAAPRRARPGRVPLPLPVLLLLSTTTAGAPALAQDIASLAEGAGERPRLLQIEDREGMTVPTRRGERRRVGQLLLSEARDEVMLLDVVEDGESRRPLRATLTRRGLGRRLEARELRCPPEQRRCDVVAGLDEQLGGLALARRVSSSWDAEVRPQTPEEGRRVTEGVTLQELVLPAGEGVPEITVRLVEAPAAAKGACPEGRDVQVWVAAFGKAVPLGTPHPAEGHCQSGFFLERAVRRGDMVVATVGSLDGAPFVPFLGERPGVRTPPPEVATTALYLEGVSRQGHRAAIAEIESTVQAGCRPACRVDVKEQRAALVVLDLQTGAEVEAVRLRAPRGGAPRGTLRARLRDKAEAGLWERHQVGLGPLPLTPVSSGEAAGWRGGWGAEPLTFALRGPTEGLCHEDSAPLAVVMSGRRGAATARARFFPEEPCVRFFVPLRVAGRGGVALAFGLDDTGRHRLLTAAHPGFTFAEGTPDLAVLDALPVELGTIEGAPVTRDDLAVELTALKDRLARRPVPPHEAAHLVAQLVHAHARTLAVEKAAVEHRVRVTAGQVARELSIRRKQAVARGGSSRAASATEEALARAHLREELLLTELGFALGIPREVSREELLAERDRRVEAERPPPVLLLKEMVIHKDHARMSPAQRKALAATLMARVKAGEDFDTLALEHSQGDFADRGGWMPPTTLPELPAPLRARADELVPGAIVGLLEDEGGFAFYAVVDRKQDPPPPPPRTGELRQRLLDERRDEATLRGRAFVDERVAAMKVTVGFEVPKAPSPAPVPWWLPEGVVDDDPARGAW